MDTDIVHIRNGYRVTPPIPVNNSLDWLDAYQINVSPDCYEAATVHEVLDVLDNALKGHASMFRLCFLAAPEVGWSLVYAIDLETMPSFLVKKAHQTFYLALVTGLDRAFALPSSFDPGRVDMSFLDEEPVNPDDRCL